MKGRLTTKLGSESGASFAIALLLFLVCAAISAAVLAAATASAGQFANLGKMDQRYYSVMSAARLFQDSLDGSAPTDVESAGPGTLTFVVTQERQGQQTITRTTTGVTTPGDITTDPNATTASFSRPANVAKAFNFLPDITHYAFTGAAIPTGGIGGESATLIDELQKLDPAGTIQSADGWSWLSFSNASSNLAYTVQPTIEGATGMDVKVDARLQNDADYWRLELDFHNDATDPADQYHLYMVIAADIDEAVSEETVIESAGSDTGTTDTTYNQKITQKNTTTVVWHVEQVVPGRGFSS